MPENRKNGFPYQEPERHGHLSDGVPAAPHDEAGGERTPDGRWQPGARTAQRKGGRARKGHTALSHRAALGKPSAALRRVLCREIAHTVGGGHCGVAASLMLRWAADKTTLAEQSKVAGDFEGFRKLTESARMDILYAREHAAKEAAARPPAADECPVGFEFLPDQTDLKHTPK